MAWFDKVKRCVDWSDADQMRLAELRNWLDSGAYEMVEGLGEQLVQFKGVQPLMANTRFARRFHNVLLEWLTGLLDGSFDETYAKERRAFGQKLAEVDLTFDDVILLEGLARQQLFDLAQREMGDQPQRLSSTMHTLNKALNCDLALIYSSYLDIHDAEMERALLDRFLSITGFSPTLYESLAEAQGWKRGELVIG